MSVRGEGQGQPRQRGTRLLARLRLPARLRSGGGDQGIGVVEILVAFTIFMVCFIPLLKMIPLGAGIITQSADQRLAIAVANETLQNAQQTTIPPAIYSVPSPLPSWSLSPPTWASAPRTASQPQPGGVIFEIYTASGWCATDTAPGNTPSLTSSEQPSYHIVVKVGWGPSVSSASTAQVVVDSTELSTVTGAPAVNAPVSACPLGLT
jgi:hypothetical protein